MTKDCFINIESGKVVNKTPLVKMLADLPTGRYHVRIERKDKRTSPQNRYLHMAFELVKQGLRDIGYREIKTAEDAKYVCKSLFLSYEIDNGTGGKIKMLKRTRDLTKAEMSEFIDQIIQWSAEYLNVVIPPPGSQVGMEWASG